MTPGALSYPDRRETLRRGQLVLAVAAAEEADAEHACPACGEQVPHGVADDVALLGRRPVAPRRRGRGPVRARRAERFRGRPRPLRAEPERLERGIDLRPPAGRGDPRCNLDSPQLGSSSTRAGKAAAAPEAARGRAAPCRARIASTSLAVSGRPSSCATARVKRPPLMPIRRWIRQTVERSPASASARCQAKTCA